MKKSIKSVAPLVLIVVLCVCMSAPAFADVQEPDTINAEITEEDSETHGIPTTDEFDDDFKEAPLDPLLDDTSTENLTETVQDFFLYESENDQDILINSDFDTSIVLSSETTDDHACDNADITFDENDEDTVIDNTGTIASVSPLAELYFYNHGDTSNAQWLLDALNSTTYKTYTANCVSNAGYNTSSYTNVPAGPTGQASVLRTLPDDAFFSIIAHGRNGAVFCVDNSNSITMVTANSTNYGYGYSLQYNFSNTTNKLKYIKIAYWMGCNTYGTDTGFGFGSLPSMCTSLGVDCVVTHNSKIYSPYYQYYLYLFTYYGDNGYSVGTSLSSARTYLLSAYGYSAPYDTTTAQYITTSYYRVDGANSSPSSVYLEPASYGAY